MKYRTRIVALVVLVVAIAPALTACGNKGPLLLAPRPVPARKAAPAVQPPAGDPTEATPPAEIQPPVDAAPPSSTEPTAAPAGDGDG